MASEEVLSSVIQLSPIVTPHGLKDDRGKRRRDLLLDDGALATTSFLPRQYTSWKLALYWLAVIASGGLLGIVGLWERFRKTREMLVTSQCEPQDADVFIVTAPSGDYQICPVERIAENPHEIVVTTQRCGCCSCGPGKVSRIPVEERMVVYRHTRYVYRPDTATFTILTPEEFDPAANLSQGLSTAAAAARLARAGSNVINVPLPSDFKLFLNEGLHPFFLFQVWAVIVWCTESYYTYSAFIFFTAVASAVVNMRDVKRNLLQIRALAAYRTQVNVLREGNWLSVDSSQLVPGDLMEITNNMRAPCDIVVVQGSAAVTEGMLTGESVVVTKTPMPLNSVHNADARSTIFGGTNVVELRVARGQKVIGAVVRTGFESVKGRLVLSVLYPHPLPFKFMAQSLYFIGILFAAAMFGFGINAWQMLLDPEMDIATVVQRGCDMVTIVVPPALPLALSVGVMYAVITLRKERVVCIAPSKVNLAGKVNCVCFDKTGTLTTEGLELSTLHPATNGAFLGAGLDRDAVPPALLHLLATCHSLTHVNGTLCGDPLEVQTFKFCTAIMEESHTSDLSAHADALSRITVPAAKDGDAATYLVLRQFEFQPALQRMSVLARSADGAVHSFVKGSPEMIKELCLPATIPANFESVLNTYTRRGFRVLGAAHKPVSGDAAATQRADAESALSFAGFIILENKLKAETTAVVSRLRNEAAVTMHMVTGDNPVAAVCVARECGIVEADWRVFIGDLAPGVNVGDGGGRELGTGLVWTDTEDENQTLNPQTLKPTDGSANVPYRLALTGRAFTHLLAAHRVHMLEGAATGSPVADFFPRIILNCAVFARMSPDDKAALVSALQSTGLYVLMVGDGANDSMALREAHVGISLSREEASVAAPFTFTHENPSIEAVPLVMAEGRGALTTSFCLFQFMALYSTIQFANALLIVFASSFLSNSMYLWQDLFTVYVLSLTLGNTPSARTLTVKRPSGRLFSAYNLLLTFGFIALTFGLQAHVFIKVREQEWYGDADHPTELNSDDDVEGTNSAIPETSTVFLMSFLQYFACAILFSIGAPWKQTVLRNRVFCFWLAVVFICSLLVFFTEDTTALEFLSLQGMPQPWLRELFGWSVLSFFTYFAYWGLCLAGRYYGVYRYISTMFGAREKQHKRLRRQWRSQFGLPYLPQNAGAPATGSKTAAVAAAPAAAAASSASTTAAV